MTNSKGGRTTRREIAVSTDVSRVRATTVVTAISLAAWAAHMASAATITVCPKGCDFTDIQQAIDASTSGDIIEIAAGTYAPPATLTTNGKAITLRGATNADGTPTTIIDGQGVRQVCRCDDGEGAATQFENLVITGGRSADGGGMYFLGSSPTLTNCTIIGNTATSASPVDGGGGVWVSSSSARLTNCRIIANLAMHGGGLHMKSSYPILTNCTISENTAAYIGGGVKIGGGSPTLTGCTISGNATTLGHGMGGGVYVSSASPTLTETRFCGNHASLSSQVALDTGASLAGSGNCFAISCDDSDGDGWPDECGTGGDGVREVPGKYKTIEAAVLAAWPGDLVLVGAGTYTPAVTVNPMGKAISIRGATHADGSPATVIDA